MKSVRVVGLALVASALLFASLAWAQGGNPPASTKESGATSGHGMTAAEQTAKGETGKPAHHAAKSADFKAEVQKNADEWRVAYNAKDADKVASMYTDDAVFINPDGSFHGSGDIKGELKKLIDSGGTTDAIITTKAVQSGDLGFAEGTYSGKARTQSGGEKQTHGQWAATLKKVNDKWLLATHTALPGAEGAAKAAKQSE